MAEAVSGKKTNVGVGDKLAGDRCKHNLFCVWGGGGHKSGNEYLD